jgi:hypothetical protein
VRRSCGASAPHHAPHTLSATAEQVEGGCCACFAGAALDKWAPLLGDSQVRSTCGATWWMLLRRRVLLRVLDLAWAGVPQAPTAALARELLTLGFRRADALHVAAA